VTPHFRTYWLPQNITEMQGYTAAVSDLYREGAGVSRRSAYIAEEANDDDVAMTQSSQAVHSVLPLVPKDFGFYQARSTDAKASLAAFRKRFCHHTRRCCGGKACSAGPTHRRRNRIGV